MALFCRYQEGDVIRLFPVATESLQTVTEPRTKKGSAAAIPKAVGGGKRAENQRKRKETPKETHDCIAELEARGEKLEQDPGAFARQLQMDKMVTMTTDGGARTNPAVWGVLIRQNGKFICL
jgi:hypothetical protein